MCMPWRLAVVVLKVRPVLVCTCIFFVAAIVTAVVMTSPAYSNVKELEVSDACSLKNQSNIIVGAGASCLFCAYTLAYLGFQNFAILEASNGFGGRVKELDFVYEVPLDAGAEWIHVHLQVLQGLLLFPDQTVNMETITYQPQTFGAYLNGKVRKRNWIRFFYQEWKFKQSTWYAYLKEYILPHVKDKNEYNAAVSEINYSIEDIVTVTITNGQTFQADKIVISTPAAVLQAGDIAFIPPLPPDKLIAIDNIHMENGVKVWFEFDQRFYPDLQMPSTLWNFLFGDDSIYFDVLFRKDIQGRNVLGHFHVGPDATWLVATHQDELVSTLLLQLDDMYNGKATQHYIRHVVVNWSKQPFTKGAYSTEITDWSWTMKELRKLVQGNRIYFCGEHTEEEDQATVHGAAKMGRRVAQDMILHATAATVNYHNKRVHGRNLGR